MHPLENALAPFMAKHPETTIRQLVLLSRLPGAEAATRTVRHLAQALDISKPAVTRSIDRLEADGFAKRRNDPNDKRSIFVEITALGLKILASSEAFVRAGIAKDNGIGMRLPGSIDGSAAQPQQADTLLGRKHPTVAAKAAPVPAPKAVAKVAPAPAPKAASKVSAKAAPKAASKVPAKAASKPVTTKRPSRKAA